MTLLPDKTDFTIWKGATFRKLLTLYTGSTATTGQERPLTGYTAELVIRDKPEGTPLLTLDTTGTGIVLGGSAGTIELFISATDTAAISWKSGVYDLTITAPGGDTDALLYGGFRVRGI